MTEISIPLENEKPSKADNSLRFAIIATIIINIIFIISVAGILVFGSITKEC